jgi:hypothetical protein
MPPPISAARTTEVAGVPGTCFDVAQHERCWDLAHRFRTPPFALSDVEGLSRSCRYAAIGKRNNRSSSAISASARRPTARTISG